MRLAGTALPWRYKDSDRLGDWIDSRPWTGSPTVRVLRVADRTSPEHLFDAIRDAVTAADRNATGVEVTTLEATDVDTDGFGAAVAKHLDISATRQTLELAMAFGRASKMERPTLWLIPPLTGTRPQVIDETEQFVELVKKLEPSARFTVLFTDTPIETLTGRHFDFTTGGPAIGTDIFTVLEDHLWAHYMHRRVAWEVGGNYSLAKRLSTAVEEAKISRGDDSGFEHVLGQEAQIAYSELPQSMKDALPGALTAKVGDSSRRNSVMSTMFWNPSHFGGLALVPWIARSLLALNPVRPFADSLRGSLVCLPICQELLTACFFLETHVRGQIHLPPYPPDSAKCREAWGRFTNFPGYPAILYPSGSPSVPTNPWAFASLGELLTHEIAKPFGTDWRHDLRQLRNHLAHCQYSGWEAVRLARHLASRVST